MTRVTESQLASALIGYVQNHRTTIQKLNEEISTGIKVNTPGDSNDSGTISQFRQSLDRVESYKNRITSVQSFLTFQDDALNQANELLVRAKEIASQAANETNSATTRAQMAEEVFQIRDHLVSLANSTYQGKYVYGGADDDDPPYDANVYTVPPTGGASQRYVFDAEPGTSTTRSVQLTDDLSITTNTPGNQIFDNGIQAMERLGRALAGYQTNPAVGAPDGTGAAYTFPAQYSQQTADIRNTIDLLNTARQNDILPERVSISGRMRRIETAKSLLDLTKASGEEVLDRLQNTDVFDSASQLSQAQTALQASLTVSTQVLKLSILDFL